MSQHDLGRLKWQCRRGMLELDHVLERYLDELFIAAPEAEQSLFVELLTVEDQTLHHWLIVADEAPPERFVDLIRRIRRV